MHTRPASPESPCLAVVIPCYKVTRHIGGVLRDMGPEVELIVCVDDACPDGSGKTAQEALPGDPRLHVVTHEENQGVGGAVLTGYKEAVKLGATCMVKIDGDGQMDPALISRIAAPVLMGQADYVKGNRFFNLEDVRAMPMVRLIGNAGLSFLSKVSSGYWNLFDPTNGFTAIHANVAAMLPMDRISKRYFFESDMLFRLNTLRAVVVDVPMAARYEDEESGLNVKRALVSFPFLHGRNFLKRIFYNYFLRNFSFASLNLVLGFLLFCFGVVFGGAHWIHSTVSGTTARSGTVMIAAVAIILGFQLLLNFFNADMADLPREPVHKKVAGLVSHCIPSDNPPSPSSGDNA